jgi:hypothetical protein
VIVARASEPIIDGRSEAALCVGPYCLALLGGMIGTLMNPWGWALFLVIPFDVWLLFRRLALRLGIARSDRRMLRMWLGPGAQYQAWRVLFSVT